MKTGIQVSSLKPVLTTCEEVQTAFEKMKVMGCEWVQLQWIDPAVPVEFIADCLQKTGIRSVSVQDFYEVIRQNKQYYIDLNARTGGKWMCVSRIPERLKTREGLDAYVAELRAFQQELDAYGQELCFHAVSADFAPIEGLNPVEYLFDAMPEMAICVDLYHVNKVSLDMNEWLRRYEGRICMVHFKDEADGRLVPAGQGDTNWSGVVQTCMDTGVEYGFVEQERWDRDPFECMQEALDWLNGKKQNALTQECVTIRIPGLKRSYTFLHTSDCHLAYARPDEGEEAAKKAAELTAFWSYAGRKPAEAMEEVLRMADGEKADGLFLCGDVADYLSDGTMEAVRGCLKQAKTELFYVCGNHERSGVEPAGSRDFYPAYADLMHGSPGFWTHDFGEFVIVGMDDGDKQIREEQLELLQKQFEAGKPVLLLIHIPIMTEAIMPPVQHKWGQDGPNYFLLGQERDTELSQRFCRMLADPAAPIAAVFAGHIHLSHAGEIIPGRMQYVSSPAFEGRIRKYMITGK